MGERYLVKPVDGPIDWTVEVPGSKSMTNRALLIAALSEGMVELEGVLFSEDSRHFLSSLQALGFPIQIDEEQKRVILTGCNGNIPAKQAVINVGSAGTAARFLTAMLGFSDGVYTVLASSQMKRRPMKPLFDLLEGIGAKITCLEQEGCLPVQICGLQYQKSTQEKAEQKKLYTELDISKSTQFLSAMLLISPMAKMGLSIHITSEKKDGAYIRITRKMMESFGARVSFGGTDYETLPHVSYRRKHYTVEPDVSAACYFYGAAAITGGRALVKNVHMDNTQGDLKFLEVLEKMGCTVHETEQGIAVMGPSDGKLAGITADMNDFSDQALTLAAIAPYASGKVSITNVGHIRQQESDRLHVIAAELTKRGISCAEEASAVTISPGNPGPGVVETYEDHRVAMAFSLMGLKTDGIEIENPKCCAKTFETYFAILSRLTGK